jgi:putative membrane protein
MVGFLDEAYLWVKAFHIIAIIAWMAGMLYLPRLFVYHCDAEPGSVQSETFKVMERRLLRAIINPAMVLAWVLGVALVAHLDAWSAPWMQAKFAAAIALSTLHGFFSRCLPGHERGPDTAHDRHRAPGGAPAVLGS